MDSPLGHDGRSHYETRSRYTWPKTRSLVFWSKFYCYNYFESLDLDSASSLPLSLLSDSFALALASDLDSLSCLELSASPEDLVSPAYIIVRYTRREVLEVLEDQQTSFFSEPDWVSLSLGWSADFLDSSPDDF